MSNVEVYRQSMTAVVERLAAMPDDHPVPATPAWDARTLLSHVVGVAVDVADGRVDDYAMPDWTDAQVRARADRSRVEFLDEWANTVDRLAEVLAHPTEAGLGPEYSVLPVLDLVAHRADLAEAVGDRPELDAIVLEIVGPRRQFMLDLQVGGAGLPPLQVSTREGDSWVVGGSDPMGSVAAPRVDLWRSLEGRRPWDVVRGFDWSVDPEPYLPVWPSLVFSWPTSRT